MAPATYPSVLEQASPAKVSAELVGISPEQLSAILIDALISLGDSLRQSCSQTSRLSTEQTCPGVTLGSQPSLAKATLWLASREEGSPIQEENSGGISSEFSTNPDGREPRQSSSCSRMSLGSSPATEVKTGRRSSKRRSKQGSLSLMPSALTLATSDVLSEGSDCSSPGECAVIGEQIARQYLLRQLSAEEALARTEPFSNRQGYEERARAFAGLTARPGEWGDMPVFTSLRRPSSFCIGFMPTVTKDARIAVSFADGSCWLVAPEMLELAQGLPVGWTAGMTERGRADALGDALAAPVAEAWARAVAGLLPR